MIGLCCQRGGVFVEAQNIPQHSIKAWVQQIAALRKNGVQIGAGPLQVRCAGRLRQRQFHRKRHVGGSGFNIQFFEQAHQIRIRLVIEYQKTGIHAVGMPIQRDVHGMGVSAEIVVGLEQGDVIFLLRQPVGG